MPWGAIGSAAIGAGASLLGGYMSNRANSQANQFNIEWARESQKKDQDFQREVFQNQYQWKADDAKKAGLHPLAIIGGGTYSASPTSQPVNVQPNDYSFIGKLGEGVGDAFTAYMSKDQIAKRAAEEKAKADKREEAQGRLLDAQTEYYSALALEASRRALGHTKPMANGREVMKGQTDSNGPFYAIRYLGNGQYDINLTTDHQQELGDELGQIYNFVRKGSREGSLFDSAKYHLSGGRFGSRYGNTWTDPATKQKYRFDRETGFWEKVR